MNMLQGRLCLSSYGSLYLSVPNALVLGAYRALPAAGLSLPFVDGKLNAKITVMTPAELRGIGGGDKISERGKSYEYRLLSLESGDDDGMDTGYSRSWYFRVSSPQLSQLRRTYGLAGEPQDTFHITVARRRTGVLYSTPVSKLAMQIEEEHDWKWKSGFAVQGR